MPDNAPRTTTFRPLRFPVIVLLQSTYDIVRQANVKFATEILKNVNAIRVCHSVKKWLRGLDLNQRPSGYEPDELPGCSTPRDENTWDMSSLQIEKVSQLQQTYLSFAASRLR